MTKTSGKRKQHAKRKNKNSRGGGGNSLDRGRRCSTSRNDINGNGLDHQELESLSGDSPYRSSPMSTNPNLSPSGLTPSKKRHPPKWEPMAHTCGVCYSKTTSEKFKRTCFNKHEFVCDRFHKTLLRAGKQDHCSACMMEREMEDKRRAQMKSTLDIIEGLEVDPDDGGSCGNRKAVEIKNHRAKYDSLTNNFFEIRENTERELQDRKEGFLIWKAS